MVETVITALNDAQIMTSLSKPAKAAVVCALMCALGLIFVTRAGLHWLELFDSFACNVTLFIGAPPHPPHAPAPSAPAHRHASG